MLTKLKKEEIFKLFDKRFPYRVRADHCADDELAMMDDNFRLVSPGQIKAFIESVL